MVHPLLQMLLWSLFVVTFLGLSSSSPAGSDTNTTVLGPVSKLHISNGVVAPDGYDRSAVLVNGVIPAPLIRASKADHFCVQVFNGLTDATMPLETSIVSNYAQKTSNWADGVSFVTQCPLRQNETFEYKFDVAHQSGTYWYHSHYSTQYCDGLRGPLVIYDHRDPLAHMYDVDDEDTVITLSDWYHEPSIQLQNFFSEVDANSTLINGRGRYPGGPASPLSVIHIQSGLRYRFRLVSLACHASFNFTIDGHRMAIIEVDGNEVFPIEVDSIPIYAGQRYSVVVTANRAIENYWIRVASGATNASFEGGQNMAILRYEGAPEQEPTTDPGPHELSFDEGRLHPLINPGAPGIPEIGKADVNLELVAGTNESGYFTINNVSYAPPPVPVLLQILSGARHPSTLLPNGSVYELPLNKVVEISFSNPTLASGGPHPMHLHGHAFDVVRVAGSNATNFVNPVRRDVVSMGNSGTDNVTIRFATDNAGPWFLHCHIDWHLYHGFAVVMAEAPREAHLQEAAVVPSQWYQLCPSDMD